MSDSLVNDKLKERKRYDERAESLLAKCSAQHTGLFGSAELPLLLRAPYEYFENQIRSYVQSGSMVLEIGSGIGMHTGILLETGGIVMATDISQSSLEYLRIRFKKYSRLNIGVADMECLPFRDNCFNVVSSSGSLSYGDNLKVMREIYRVLRPGGVFICVDSLNHNPIYRLNRWLHYCRGNRTISTLKRMPRLEIINQYKQLFGSMTIKYFGAISWAAPLLSRLFADKLVVCIEKKVDAWLNVKCAAFKFVMVVRKDA